MINSQPFVIERMLNAPAEKVWQAITDKEHMKKWYFDIPAFRPEIGCEFTFEGQDGPTTYVHLCKITELIPGQKITYSWRYEGYEGISYVSFELSAEGEKTKLRLTHTGLESFPQNNPSFAKECFAKGWGEIIGKLLPEYLARQAETVI